MKFNKKIIWAILEQTVFAMFLIVAFYAIGFSDQWSTGRGITPSSMLEKPDVDGYQLGHPQQIGGLAIAAIVIAFVTILLPLVSSLYGNHKMNFILGWSTIIIDSIVVILATASISLWASDQIIDSVAKYDKGYLAGQFILLYVGAAIAYAGSWASYKNELKHF